MSHSLQLALQLVAWLITLAWIWKAITAARGLPTIPNLLLPQYNVLPAGNPLIAVVVPARNEADNIAATLQTLLAQNYPNLFIIAIDDRSTDSTGDIITTLANQYPHKLNALHITELPSGWLGKTHAMAMGAQHAIAIHQPDYLLFTDADILFQPQAIRISLAQAVATQADHFVTFPTPLIESLGEGMLLGYLGVLGLWATRPWLASDPKAMRDFIGIGAFNLLRTSAYQQLGGFGALRMEILEDLTLARSVKLAGLRQRVAVAPGVVTLHWATGASGVIQVMTKNLFALFQFRPIPLLLACFWFAMLCIAPVALLAFSLTRTPAILACASIGALYILSSRYSKVSPWYVLFLPIAAAAFIYSILRSAFVTLRQGGVTWRGTFYPLAELRKKASPFF